MKRHILIAFLAVAAVGLSACEKGDETTQKSAASETGTAVEEKGTMDTAKDMAKKTVDTAKDMAKKTVDAAKEMTTGTTTHEMEMKEDTKPAH